VKMWKMGQHLGELSKLKREFKNHMDKNSLHE